MGRVLSFLSEFQVGRVLFVVFDFEWGEFCLFSCVWFVMLFVLFRLLKGRVFSFVGSSSFIFEGEESCYCEYWRLNLC